MVSNIETTRTGLKVEDVLSSFDSAHQTAKEIMQMAIQLFDDTFVAKHCSFRKDKNGEVSASFVATSEKKAVYFSVKTQHSIPVINWRIYTKKVNFEQVVAFLNQDI